MLIRKQAIKKDCNKAVANRSRWIERNRFYSNDEIRNLNYIVQERAAGAC